MENTTLEYYVNVNDTQNDTLIDPITLLEMNLGARYMEKWLLIVLNIIYLTVFVTGLLGNLCTCVVIVRNRYMHTATNFYLFSLAISDLLILLLALPPELYTFWEAYPWRFGEPYCILKTYIQEVTSYASALTIALFTIERYLAICHPMTSQTHVMNSPSRAVKLICVQWLIAFVSALPYPLHTRTFYVVTDPIPLTESLMCNIPVEFRQHMSYWFQVSTFAFFVYPMTVIVVMYILIGVRLNKSDIVTDRTNAATVKARKAVIKMLVAVVVAFFVCWAPFHAQRLMTIYISDWTPELMEIQNVLFLFSGVLYFVSSTVNPILYNAMSRKYRRAFMKSIVPCLKIGTQYSVGSTFNSSPAMSHVSQYHYNKLKLNMNTTRLTVAQDLNHIKSDSRL